MKKLRVALLAAAHLFMDMTTVAFVFVLTGVREFALPENGAVGLSENAAFAVSACILAYDLIAFGAQPFLGALTDVGRRAAPALYLSLSVAGVAAVLCVLCGFPQGIHAFSVALYPKARKRAHRWAFSCRWARSAWRRADCTRLPCCFGRASAVFCSRRPRRR